jgi:hypothetical protein
VLAVKVSVLACMPAEVGLPRNHSAAPGNAVRVVIIGIQDGVPWLEVMTRPCAVPESALMISMLTRAPALTVMAGLTSPPMRKVSSRPPAGLALLPDPEALLLDEPYAGFDFDTYLKFWNLVARRRAAGRSVLIIGHFVTDEERFDRIVTLRDGKAVLR